MTKKVVHNGIKDACMIAAWKYFSGNEQPTPEFRRELIEWFKDRGRYLMPGYGPANQQGG